MYKNKKISAILLMGGEGKRFGSSFPKQFHKLSGKRVYLYALETLIESSFFDEILLLCHKEWQGEVARETQEYPLVKIMEGGKTRQESSYLGLLQCSAPDIVLIHDAVRPFLTQTMILENLKSALLHGAVDSCLPSSDTIIYSENSSQISSIPERKKVLRGQTPQTFSFSLILQAHKQALKNNLQNISDDCRLVMELGKKVSIVQGDEYNIKITSKLDLFIAEQILRLQPKEPHAQKVSLKNKHFLVIGGSGGIGKEIVLLLKKEGALVSSASRNSSFFSIDLTDEKNIESFFLSFHQQFGPLDGLIQSAGLLYAHPLKKLSFKEIQEMIQVNLTGLIYSCKLAQIKEGGHIVNIASSSFSRGRKNQSIYSAAKAAVVNFTQALAEERPDLHINALVPQRTNTPMRRKNFPNEQLFDLLPPEKVAEKTLDLLKDTSLTGSIVEVREVELRSHFLERKKTCH